MHGNPCAHRLQITWRAMEHDQNQPARAPRAHRRSGGDKTRRGRWLDRVLAASISRGCRAWALLLACRSSETAKPVWGYQDRQGEDIDCSGRTVRRYRRELEAAGLIETQRGEVIRHPDGRFSQQMTNRYCFVVPPRPTRRKPSSDRADTGDRLNPVSTRQLETFGTNLSKFVEDDPPPEAWSFNRGLIGAAKSQLRRSQPA